jgi:hypothetical protein
VPPPAWRAAEADQASRLRGNAVRGHQLLLFADRADEVEHVHAEAEHADQRHQPQRKRRPQRGADTRAPACVRCAGARRREHEERQHQAGRHLHADARRERSDGGAHTWIGAGARQQRDRQREHEQCVVVRSADCQHEHHRVQAHKRARPRRRVSQPAGRARDQRDRREAREHRERLERPQPARQPERRDRIAQQGEQRSVRRVLKWPADEVEHAIRRRFRGEVRIWVQPVQHPHARERQIAEHVLRDQRRAKRHERIREHDRRRDRSERQPPRDRQHQQVARAHDQRERLEARARQPYVEAVQGAGEPRRPAAAARGDVLPRRRRGAGAREEGAREDSQQPQRSQQPRELRRRVRAPGPVRAGSLPGGHPGGG